MSFRTFRRGAVVLTIASATLSTGALAGTAAIGLLLSACGGSGGSDSGSGPVSLTVWTGFTGGDRPGYDQIVKDFNTAHPDIKVTMTVQPWDTIQQKLPSAWLTGQGPDIAAPSSDPNAIAQYVKTNSVLPITATGTGDDKVNADQFAPALVKEGVSWREVRLRALHTAPVSLGSPSPADAVSRP